ncbi:MAG: tetratricopeptide repeat protein [Thermodesulfobacteriota bacterium]
MNIEFSGPARMAVVTICFLIFFVSLNCYGDTEVVLNEENQFQFAERYFRNGEYYRAIGEYERLLYFFPRTNKAELVKYRIGLSYLKAEQYEKAIQAFYQLIEEYQNTGYAFKSYLDVSKAYVRLNQYAMALTTLSSLIAIAPDLALRDKAYYHRAWVYLEMGLWEKAVESFQKISPQNRETYNLDATLADLKAELPVSKKNPTLAGLLAVVPGAGHLYCGRKRDALITLVLNGLMIYAAYEAFDNDLTAIGSIITLFELGFYGGNIYSAVSSAHKYNRDAEARLLDELKEKARVDISLGNPPERSLMLVCRFSF